MAGKNPQQTGYTGSLQVASLKLLHSVDHDTQEKKIHNREEKSIHTQQLYN